MNIIKLIKKLRTLLLKIASCFSLVCLLFLVSCGEDSYGEKVKEVETCDEFDSDCDETVDPVETGEPTIEIEEPVVEPVEPEPSVTEPSETETESSSPTITETESSETDSGSITVNTDDCDATTWFLDFDQDGYGNEKVSVVTCTSTGLDASYPLASYYVTQAGDCIDFNASIYPGATEIFNNSIDENCDGVNATIDFSNMNFSFTIESNCDDESDNDGDGFADCDDLDCSASSSCWNAKAIWTGFAFSYDSGKNKEIGNAASYLEVEDVKVEGSSGGGALSATVKHSTRFGKGSETNDYHSTGYAYLIAYNKTYLRIGEVSKEISCSGDANGQCTGWFIINLKEAFGSTTPFDRFSKATIFLSGFSFRYEAYKDKNVKDFTATFYRTDDNLEWIVSDPYVTIYYTVNFNGNDTPSYDITLYGSLILYDPNYSAFTTFDDIGDGSDWGSYTYDDTLMHYFKTEVTTLNVPFSVAGIRENNIFGGFKSFGWNEGTSYEINTLKNYMSAFYESYAGSYALNLSVLVTGALYKDGIDPLHPNEAKALVFVCKDDTVCKRSDLIELSVSGDNPLLNETEEQDLSITGLPFAE